MIGRRRGVGTLENCLGTGRTRAAGGHLAQPHGAPAFVSGSVVTVLKVSIILEREALPFPCGLSSTGSAAGPGSRSRDRGSVGAGVGGGALGRCSLVQGKPEVRL